MGVTRRSRRRLAGLLGAAALVFAVAGDAHAGLPGVPQIVFDPTAVGKLATQISRQYQQIRLAEQSLSHLRSEARRYSRLPLVSFATRQRGYARLFSEGNLLGYNNPALDRVFQSTFPQSRLAERLRSVPAQQRDLLRRAAYALVMGARQHGAQLREAEAVLAQARSFAAGATSAAQIAQSQAALGALAVEEQQQARQLQVAASNQQAVMDAYRLGRDARADSLDAAGAAQTTERERRAADYVGRFKEENAVSSDVWKPGRTRPARPQ
jgi:hypothetical protein